MQVASGTTHSINRSGIQEICDAVIMTADAGRFQAAHDALLKMLQPAGGSSARAKLHKRKPLLVFVTPDTQYQSWRGLQPYTVCRAPSHGVPGQSHTVPVCGTAATRNWWTGETMFTSRPGMFPTCFQKS